MGLGDHRVPYGTIWYHVVPYCTIVVPYGVIGYHMVRYGTSGGWKSTRRRECQPKHRWGTHIRAVCPNFLLNDKVAIIPFTWCASYFPIIFSFFFNLILEHICSVCLAFCLFLWSEVVWLMYGGSVGLLVGRSFWVSRLVGRTTNHSSWVSRTSRKVSRPVSRPTRKLVVYFDGTMVIHG